jgi:hypothetical protein
MRAWNAGPDEYDMLFAGNSPRLPVSELRLEALQLGLRMVQLLGRGVQLRPPLRGGELGLRLALFPGPIFSGMHDQHVGAGARETKTAAVQALRSGLASLAPVSALAALRDLLRRLGLLLGLVGSPLYQLPYHAGR